LRATLLIITENGRFFTPPGVKTLVPQWKPTISTETTRTEFNVLIN